MHINKHLLFIVGVPAILVLLIILTGLARDRSREGAVIGHDGKTTYASGTPLEEGSGVLPAPTETGRVAHPGGQGGSGSPEGKLKAANFTGTLTEVNTGCFADGECYAVVDGKHVTLLWGWTQEVVGSVQGTDGIGGLQNYIGTAVEVYAHDMADGSYTLYGSEGFYVKPIGATQVDPVVQEPPSPTTGAGCQVGGCSGQLCGEAGGEPLMSTCEWTDAYACYRTARCEKQANGACGWTQTTELSQCLIDARSGTPAAL